MKKLLMFGLLNAYATNECENISKYLSSYYMTHYFNSCMLVNLEHNCKSLPNIYYTWQCGNVIGTHCQNEVKKYEAQLIELKQKHCGKK